jgi:hypothetical protein
MNMSKHKFKPESLMMSHGYKPELSEGAIKPPIFQKLHTDLEIKSKTKN